MEPDASLPVVVIGAGPVGLAAAAHLLERGLEPLVLEAGDGPGAAIRAWGHIRLFSTWRYNIDAAARRLLEHDGGWDAPRETRLPYGTELVDDYLAPLAALPELRGRIRYGNRVTGVVRGESGFLVRHDGGGSPGHDDGGGLPARAVIDASGTWDTPNPAGGAGLPAVGESAARAAGLVTGPLPDVPGADAGRFAGRTVLVLGSGHSAANTLLSLGRVRQKHPETRILWAIRRPADPARLYGGGTADQLPARGQLGASLRRFVENGDIELVDSFATARLDVVREGAVEGTPTGNAERAKPLRVTAADGRTLAVDVVVPCTGFRPDLAPLAGLRLDLDEAVQAPRGLGPLIDPEFHSCGTVPAHGERLLAHPEPAFYIAGMKSYGRAPTFLMATGYEQVRSLAAALAGDRAGADRLQLDLPQTGACSTDSGGSAGRPAGSVAG